ncbi:MAG: AI-2E family transporter, partial [Thermoleophilia bacterium]|nr:AI-2E family transporter [Thermoleophilia bacterium]
MSSSSPTATTTTSSTRAENQTEGAPTNVRIDVPASVIAKMLFVVLAFVLGVLIVKALTGFLIQFAIALFLAIAADPVVRRLERAGIGRGRAIAIVMVTAFVAVGGALSVFVPPLVQQGDRLITNAPGIVTDARDSKLIHQLDKRFGIVNKATDEAGKLPKVVGEQVGSLVGAVVAGIFGALSILFLTLFLLAGGGQAARGTVRVFPRLAERRWWAIIQGAYTGISAYVGGAIIIALLGGGSVALMAFILGL